MTGIAGKSALRHGRSRWRHQRLQVVCAAGVSAILSVSILMIATLDVRHSAEFGFIPTLDIDRAVAVSGGEVQPNFDNFDRVDVDLRAYSVIGPSDRIDLIMQIRPVGSGDSPIRSVPFSVDAGDIPSDKGSWSNVSDTVRFEPIMASTGQRYYVSIERGPRNRDDVIAVWSITSYSSVPGYQIVGGLIRRVSTETGLPAALALVIGTSTLVFGGTGWMLWSILSVTTAPVRSRNATTGVHSGRLNERDR